jgi:hypothetical protein
MMMMGLRWCVSTCQEDSIFVNLESESCSFRAKIVQSSRYKLSTVTGVYSSAKSSPQKRARKVWPGQFQFPNCNDKKIEKATVLFSLQGSKEASFITSLD